MASYFGPSNRRKANFQSEWWKSAAPVPSLTCELGTLRIKMALVVPLFILVVINFATSQNPSPCPKIFSYEPRGTEVDRWYGVLSIQSTEDLNGVWIHVILDRPAELLGNWFGEASSSDNQEYTIRNQRYKLEAGPPVSVRFFVKYNAASTIPSVKGIRLNGKTVCSAQKEEGGGGGHTLHLSTQTGPSSPSGPSRPNNRPASTSSEREPSENAGGSNGGGKRPTQQGGRRPSGGGSSNSGTRGEATSSEENNFGTSGSSSQGRPSGGGSSNVGGTRGVAGSQGEGGSSSDLNQGGSRPTNQSVRRPGSSSSGNGLSVEDGSPNNGLDFFPGDFAVERPTFNRPSSRPYTVTKRTVGCGTVAMRASPLISNGQNTSQGQFPWHVALYHSQGIQLMYTCGGTLISESHVITAAHCVAKPQTRRSIDTQNLLVYLGKYNLKKFGTEVQDREVSEIRLHPQYNYTNFFNDIAVIKLSTPADITNYVRPCCMWDGDTELDGVLNKFGTVVGWGFDENRQLSNNLMQAQMPVVSTVKCIYSNREFFSQFTFEKNYCAGFRNGTSVCNGDSGGGMVFPKPGSGDQNPVWQIRGIVSVGVALQGQGVCDPNHYIVFTDVAKYTRWIEDITTNQ